MEQNWKEGEREFNFGYGKFKVFVVSLVEPKNTNLKFMRRVFTKDRKARVINT